jgi:hypothetical protein
LVEGCLIVTAASYRMARAGVPHIPATALIAAQPFPGGESGERVGAAIVAGLQARGWEEADVLALPADAAGTDPRAVLDAVGFDARMRRSRAVVVVAARLSPHTLTGSTAFELATRARQAGVPAYAVAATSELGAFDTRMLDLQIVLSAPDRRALRAAGRRLAELL